MFANFKPQEIKLDMLYNNDPNFVAGGTPLDYEIIDGQMVFRNTSRTEYINSANADYLKSQSPVPQGLNKIKSDTVSHTGFSKSRVINDDEKTERQQQLDRLAILQNTEARLLKDLERTRSFIKSIKADLSI